MRLTDVVLSFPLYLLLFVLSAFIAAGAGAQNIVVIVLLIVAVSWTYIARLVRGEFLSPARSASSSQAARAVGVAAPGIIAAPPAAQRRCAARRQRHPAGGQQHHPRIGAELLRLRRAAAHLELGQHAGRRAAVTRPTRPGRPIYPGLMILLPC